MRIRAGQRGIAVILLVAVLLCSVTSLTALAAPSPHSPTAAPVVCTCTCACHAESAAPSDTDAPTPCACACHCSPLSSAAPTQQCSCHLTSFPSDIQLLATGGRTSLVCESINKDTVSAAGLRATTFMYVMQFHLHDQTCATPVYLTSRDGRAPPAQLR